MAVKCLECGKVFGGVTPFDLHRAGTFESFENGRRVQRCTRHCLSESEMRAKGLMPLSRGLWGQPAYSTQKETPSC